MPIAEDKISIILFGNHSQLDYIHEGPPQLLEADCPVPLRLVIDEAPLYELLRPNVFRPELKEVLMLALDMRLDVESEELLEGLERSKKKIF